ncbi:putative claudin-24 [Clinocottus analis]|uniref:putative claudin-24 n=1 Tax=Clinocottus analis TaxID=304258 RepID=UPI0035C1D164
MDSLGCALELLGMLLFAAAWLCALATVLLPQWLTMSTALMPAESYGLGLWETCVVQDLGVTECRSYDSLLGLPGQLKLARVLMCSSLAAGLLGMLVAAPGLQLVNGCCGGARAKSALTAAGGALGLASGVLCLIPVSYMAHLAVAHFFDDTVPDMVPRWEFGEALFCGWAAGFLLVAAGLLLLSSRWRSPAEAQQPAPPQRRYQVMSAAAAASPRKRSEYV